MNKRIKKLSKKIISLLIVISLSLTLFACKKKVETYEVALVTDVGQLMDQGFNQGTYEGIQEYCEKNFVSYAHYVPENGANATDEDRMNAMERAIEKGAKIIVAPGFGQGEAIQAMAKKYKSIKFVYVDGETFRLKNITALTFREEESGYIAGYAAVKEGYRKIGATLGGGGVNPACNRYGYGFIQGIQEAAKEENANVEIRYSYKNGSTYEASEELEAQMDAWYKSGTEIIFACGGSMFDSVKTAAEKTENGKIIGVDVDQSYLSERVITSAVKNLRISVIKVLDDFYSSRWDVALAGRALYLGVEDNATGIVVNPRLEKFKTPEYNEILQRIKAIDVIINNKTPEDCNDAGWLNKAVADTPNVKILFEK